VIWLTPKLTELDFGITLTGITQMRITSKGQVTIPLEYRKRFGFLPETDVEFVPEGRSLRLKKSARGSDRMKAWITHARGTATVKLSTDEIMRHTRHS
jgi:bifunctional DNA-binding transcriptional regulator/antitoxin component of YhaV-PrlF toxin-antitoxin module